MKVHEGKTRFINVQRHFANCGPIAIANAVKWHGRGCSYDNAVALCQGLGAHHPYFGMWPIDIFRVLKWLGARFRVRRNFDVEFLDHEITEGRSVILIYGTSGGNHAVFVDAHVDGGFRAWNFKRRDTPFASYSEMARILSYSAVTDRLYAYVLSKTQS